MSNGARMGHHDNTGHFRDVPAGDARPEPELFQVMKYLYDRAGQEKVI